MIKIKVSNIKLPDIWYLIHVLVSHLILLKKTNFIDSNGLKIHDSESLLFCFSKIIGRGVFHHGENILFYICFHWREAVVEWLGQKTHVQEIAGSNPGWM
jgi:hypothetical protein